MLGNLSQTVIKVPNFFNLLAKLSSNEFVKTRYREPPLLDTFSQLKKVNSHLNKRYFRLNDHFKENSPYKDLNYNNNKKFISPISKYPLRSFEQFFYPEYNEYNHTLKRNNSQAQIISISRNFSKDNLNKNNTFENNDNLQMENNRYNSITPINNEEQKLPNIKENIIGNKVNEGNKNDNEINKENNDDNSNENADKVDDEQKKIEKYMQMLRDRKPNNLKELKEYLDIKYMDETKKNELPRIKRIHKSMSQDDLFKKTIDKKIQSLTVINPDVKNSLYRRKKNMILKRDYDLLQKIHANNANLPYRFKNSNISGNEVLY